MEYKEQQPIHILGSVYFALKNITLDEVITRLNISRYKDCIAKDAFMYLYNQDFKSNEINVIVSHQIENWTFLYIKHGSYDDCKSIVQKLLCSSESSVNFYFSDSCIDCYQWIISKNGEIIREFAYSMSIISKDIGSYVTNIEKEFVNNIALEKDGKECKFIFGEDVAESIFESTCELLSFPENLLFTIGQIHFI
jgi:hypothetical protein